MMQFRLLVLLAAQLLPLIHASTIPQVPLLSHEITQEHFDDNFDVDLAERRVLLLSDDADPVSEHSRRQWSLIDVGRRLLPQKGRRCVGMPQNDHLTEASS
jgi:hypothetical protein